MLVYYLYIPANYSEVLALTRTHFMYLISADSLHLSSINHKNTYTSSSYKHPDVSDDITLIV